MTESAQLIGGIVIFFLATVSSAFPRSQIHRLMSPDELRQVFHVDHHSDVPEYDIVRARAITKRDAEGDISKQVHLEAFGTQHTLQLKRNRGLLKPGFPFIYADPTDGNVTFLMQDSDDDVGDPYQDVNSEAAILVHHDPEDGSLLLDGTIGPTLVVRPVPSSVRQMVGDEEEENDNYVDDELFLDDEEDIADEEIVVDGFPLGSSESSLQNQTDRTRRKHTRRNAEGIHIVYRRDVLASHSDYELMEPDHMPTSSIYSRRKRNAPTVIYPEILVIVDYDGYVLHGGDNRNIKRYYVSFMNGVDLRYKLLRDPKVKISIAGIIISRGRDATPYLEKNRVGLDAIDSAAGLTDMGKYLFKERRLPTYDIALAVTKHDLCRRRKSGKCTKGTAGFAYVGGACVVNKRLEKVNSVAIVEDTGGFSGIIVAAHEIGHLLGAVHDGSPPPSYLGGPGATRCRWEDGFIMSDLRHTEKGFRWSSCSIQQFDHFLNGDTATCLYNHPHEDNSLARTLPGKLLSLDAQCKKDRGTSACFKDDRVCAQLFCFDANTGYCVSYRPAAEGSPCGDGQYCLSGRCVAEIDNIIPDFTQHTESFLLPTNSFTQTTENKPFFTSPTTTTTRTTWQPSSTTNGNIWWTSRRTTRETRRTTRTTTTTTTPRPTTTTTTPTTTTTRRPTTRRVTFRRITTTRPPTTRRQTTTTTRQPSVFDKDTKDSECIDRIRNLVGSLTCKQFLRSYGFRYCQHKYISKNCCASHKLMCNTSNTFFFNG